MNARYVDTHCHLQFPQYDADREEIIARMREEGVACIVVGTDEESSRRAVALAEKYEHVFAAVGQHPDTPYQKKYDISYLHSLAGHPRVVAIGECGLDYFRSSDEETKRMQEELFKKQLALAGELDKPLAVHVRPAKGTYDAYEDLIEMVREAGAKKVYFASCAPALRYPCVYGVDMPTRREFVATDLTTEEVAKAIGADMIFYQKMEDFEACITEGNPQIKRCCKDSFSPKRKRKGDIY